jgi:putative tryptophan/tyrosine transport system substrate-binding protein
MRRRDFMTVLGGAAAWTLPAQAQQSAMPVIGYLGLESPELFASRVAAFRKGLAEAGYAESRNVAIAFRWAEGRYDRLPALAAELADQQVAVLIAPGGAPVALAAKAATAAIPIVFEMGGDSITLGVVWAAYRGRKATSRAYRA